MSRNHININTISAVVAGALCTITLPVGATYDQLSIETNIPLAKMKNIRVNVNNDVVEEYKDGTVLAAVNKYYKREVVDGIVDLHFKKTEMKTLSEKRQFCLGTKNMQPQTAEQVPFMPAITSVTVTFEIDASVAAPTVAVTALQSDAVPFGNFIKVKRLPVTLSAGTNEIDNIPKGYDAHIKNVFLVTDATVDKVTVIRNSTEEKNVKQSIAEKVQRENGRAPQAGYYAVDFCGEGDIKQALQLKDVRDLRFRVECDAGTAAATYGELVIEYVDTLKGV
ncbi:hypothetical protein EXU30_00060 [Shewanella maritima]|uniref:Uncharacterized protein n=1 Tax=Shewanella maritima TaxID=2520507 RepID=A0A411PCI9_9GAMM|nr:major capsid protein P2 [Shewanella maritima]QBF81263.1 hypothetical protein EXU30_00060 [Shewanella maritima]